MSSEIAILFLYLGGSTCFFLGTVWALILKI
jgi:hypothetical protein